MKVVLFSQRNKELIKHSVDVGIEGSNLNALGNLIMGADGKCNITKVEEGLVILHKKVTSDDDKTFMVRTAHGSKFIEGDLLFVGHNKKLADIRHNVGYIKTLITDISYGGN